MFFDEMKISVTEKRPTDILQKHGVYQDSTTPLCRDAKGTLWAISGHSHCGHIAMFRGTSLDDLTYAYPIRQAFSTGHADFAFNRIPYPEGIKARGSVWPMGLYVCPKTNRFFCFFHNESGWRAMGSEYDAFGYCYNPKYDSDFRHVGLMHSDDEGQTWFFDRWVLTAETVGCTEYFAPDGVKITPQKKGVVCLGSGDFSMFADTENGYIYLTYTMIHLDTETGRWEGCDMYMARTRIRDDGVMGDFVKFYNGEFSEAGNLGKESPILLGAWHPRVTYSEKFHRYFLTYFPTDLAKQTPSCHIQKDLRIRTGTDLLHWSEPTALTYAGEPFGTGYCYCAMVAEDDRSQPQIIEGDNVSFLLNHNGTDVDRFRAVIEKR